MKKRKYGILITLLSLICVSMFYAACGVGKDDGVSFLLEGILTEVELGETIKFEEYFDYTGVEEYVITVTDEDGKTLDLTGRSFWTPQEPGKYTIEYKSVKGDKKGAESFELTVAIPKLSWEYTLQNEIYDTGDILVFSDYFERMNIAADSYYPWEMVMDSVTIGNETTEFDADDTSYVFQVDGEHVFAFHIESEDGQRIGMTQSLRVRYVDKEMVSWMNENEITEYNALSLKKDGSVVLAEGIVDYSGSSSIASSFNKIDSSYIAFNGNYSFNDFVVVDFTGNNMPTITMFNDEITNSFFYKDTATDAQNKAIVINNGLTRGNGIPVESWANSVNNRCQVMGPWKTRSLGDDIEGWFRANASNNIGMTVLTNNQDARFRLIVGVTEGDADSFTVAIFLANLDTGNILENVTKEISLTSSKTVNGVKQEWKCEIPDNYYSGSIALYGQFGKTTKLNKIYPIEENTDFNTVIEKYYVASEFLSTAKTLVTVGQVLNVSDYIAADEGAEYIFAYYDESGKHEVTGETFSFDRKGKYTILYNDGLNLNAELTITVADINEQTLLWLNENGVSGFGIDNIDENRKVLLQTSAYETHLSAPTGSRPTYTRAGAGQADQSYVSFNGNYGINDFLVFEFTGNNFPYITFFDKKVDNHVFNSNSAVTENEALVICNGVTLNTGDPFSSWSASVNNRLNVVGPYGAMDIGGDTTAQTIRKAIGATGTELSLTNLSAVTEGNEKSYRVIIGFTAGTSTSFTIRMYVLDLADESVVLDVTQTVTFSTALTNPDYYSGNIALYGQFGKTTTIDKIYAIEEDTTLDALKTKYAVTA